MFMNMFYRWDRPRFLSKSFLGFVIFNTILYVLFAAELLLVWTADDADADEFYAHIFNGCYAGLMFVVVVFFLIYGVEVFFKVKIVLWVAKTVSLWAGFVCDSSVPRYVDQTCWCVLRFAAASPSPTFLTCAVELPSSGRGAEAERNTKG